ncbi:methionine ABC transporter substrate-binding protein [Campylobacter sp. MIT 99-7217]|uniref:MetQ/NlpA family ABC transporter substrate-binding protein n=1 Tax=Campylobacter sp. MIT 99-7217 TaxID=535091 RepID=UPI00115715CF|nr:MetQ/NlpA family ABC transporter substrate-binding protein [Campylobacter sp. MIT 99-7217]TQR34451.1 methionine ABC transporter substrate-binding protein [Campylobacter sp. MIT 99-7217]
MKIKNLVLASLLGLSLNLYAAEKIIVGATPVPHAEILELIKPELKKQGFELEIKEFNDYVQPNLATQSGDLDANFFQHTPYLDEFNKNNKTTLVNVAGIHLEPMGLYSSKHKQFDPKAGASIAIPNDPTNESRALDIIAKTGAISFAKENLLKTPLDIKDNAKKLKFIELKAAQLPRALSDADFAVINSNYALAANLNPIKDSLVIEDSTSPYVNILVVKKGNENTKKTQALIKALKSEAVKKFILDKYKGAVVPAF